MCCVQVVKDLAVYTVIRRCITMVKADNDTQESKFSCYVMLSDLDLQEDCSSFLAIHMGRFRVYHGNFYFLLLIN